MKYKTVDEYIESAPLELKEKLEALRKEIKKIAPQSEEKISYSMPFYEYKGRLVYFAFYEKHIGLYIPPPIIENNKEELKRYKISKSAVQFPITEPLPIPLIKKLIIARLKFNEGE